MNTARIVVLTIAIGAGGIAADPASGSDNKPAAPAEPTAQLQTVDVLVAKSDIGLGQTVKPGDLQRQTWPAATANNSFIRRNEKPDATTVDVNAVEVRSDDQANKRGESINVVRYGVVSPQTMQK